MLLPLRLSSIPCRHLTKTLLHIAEVTIDAASARLRTAGPQSRYKDQMKILLYLTSLTEESILVPWEIMLFNHLSLLTNRRIFIIMKVTLTIMGKYKRA